MVSQRFLGALIIQKHQLRSLQSLSDSNSTTMAKLLQLILSETMTGLLFLRTSHFPEDLSLPRDSHAFRLLKNWWFPENNKPFPSS